MTARSTLLCYDIADPKRLRRVAKQAEAAGLRLQKSVFECSLTPDALMALRHRLRAMTLSDADSLLYQPICLECRKRIVWQGKDPGAEHQPFWVV